jgi:L-alanine-DL-glutamate epimerase-like enolase superfamily enzyme
LTVDQVDSAVFAVPAPTAEADGTFWWNSTTVVVVHVRAGGVSGLGYTYGPEACATAVDGLLAPTVLGRDPLRTQETWDAMVGSVRNAGRPGIASLAISAVDTALWDLKARLLELPLHVLLGAGETQVPVYGSGGFTTYDDQRLAGELEGWLADGIPRVKIKIGEDAGRSQQRDRDRIRFARSVVGDDVALFVDANGAYGAGEAVRLIRSVDDARVSWFEEPVTSDDLDGLRHVRERVEPDVTAGEYAFDPWYVERMCAAGAVDCLQVDVSRCGGVTGWQKAVAVAEAHHLPVSAHCAPSLALAPCAATPRLRHMEWFVDHVRIESRLFDGFPVPTGGGLSPSDAPGHGLSLKEANAAPYRVR